MKLFEVMSKFETGQFKDLCDNYADAAHGKFVCTRMNLTSLKGCPSEIRGDFDCSTNKLESLKDGPSSVAGSYWCLENRLKSLEGIPSKIGGVVSCSYNNIKTFHNIHKIVTSMVGPFYAWGNPVTSRILGFLLIDGCTALEISTGVGGGAVWQRIVNKYLPNKEGMKGVLKCQEELFQAGFDDYAQL